MKQCLYEICVEFEELQGFLTEKTDAKKDKVNQLFFRFVNCFSFLGEEKHAYPREFAADCALFVAGDSGVVDKFGDIEMRYLILSDFYDYARLKKLFTRNIK